MVFGTTFEGIHKSYIFSETSLNQSNKGNNKITELRTILQRESQNSWNCMRCRAVIPPLALHKLMCSKVLDYSGT
jgi:hypothetical protein